MSGAIVTKEWLAAKIATDPLRTIGRALVALYNQQTSAEQLSTRTKQQNGRGFSKPDARAGSIGARQYLNSGTLDQWVVDCWTARRPDGYPRICKYAEQLNSIAAERYEVCAYCGGTCLNHLLMVCIECDGNGFVALPVKQDVAWILTDTI